MGLNEALFREVNERIDDLGERFDTPGLEIVCECGDLDCTDRIEMEREAYEELRSEDRHFAVVPGHEKPDVETVVRGGSGYLVVQKLPGGGSRVAERTAR